MKKFFKVAAALAAALSLTAFGGCEMLHDMFFSHVHEMQFVAEQPATCTQEGVREHYHCTVCNEDFADEDGLTYAPSLTIKALGHDMEYVHQVAPTCTAEGNIGYYKCSRCGGTFAAEDGEVAYSEKDIVLGKTDHTYVATEWEFDGRNHWHECSACGPTIDGSSAAHTYGEDGACTVCGYLPAGDIELGNREDISSADLSIHFIAPAVKASGDSAFIKVGDTEILVDAGPNKSNLQTIKNYINKYCTDGVLEYVIVTHADGDHILGMIGNKSGSTYNGILYTYDIQTLITFDKSNKDLTTEAGNPTDYSDYLDAVEYARSQGTAVYTGLQCYNNQGGAQRTYYLDEEQNISLNILYNYYYDHDSSDENNYSVCFLLTQELANGEANNYLFTGDLEEKGEEYLVEYNELPEVELYKAGHHGSKTSSNECLLEVIKPKHIAVCCCAGYNQYSSAEENTFPTQAFIDRVGMYTDSIYVTITYKDKEAVPMNGDIVFYYNTAEGEEQGSLKLWCSNNVTKLKETEWFKQNRTWPEGGV